METSSREVDWHWLDRVAGPNEKPAQQARPLLKRISRADCGLHFMYLRLGREALPK